MKKTTLILFIIASNICEAQMLIPEFETPKKVEALSSEAEESMPMPFNEGDNFYYFRTYIDGEGAKTRVKGQDIWFAEKKDGEWGDPYRLFRADYLPGNNSIIGTSENGERVYLYQTTYVKEGKEVKEIRKIIYLDKKGRDKWTDPVEIKIPGLVFGEKHYDFYMNSTGMVLMISMSPSESVLDEDLYVSLKQEDGSWGEIIDLGETVNTKKFEVSPFLAEDNKTLYFSSNGHEGFGGADIFVTYRIGDDWTKWTIPLNLGEPINSADFDAYFTMGNNLDIFFTSDRNDIHSNIFQSSATGKFKFANQQAIFNYANLPAEGITLQIFDADGNLIDEVQTDVYGNFTFRKLNADENYIVKVLEGMDGGFVEEDFVGSKIYFVNEEGEKTKRFIYTGENGFLDADNIFATKEIKGTFNYKELPMSKVALVVLDENGFPIDTIYTDENGNFKYNMLAYDNKYSIVPLNLNDEELNDLTMFLVDKDGNVVQKGNLIGEKFNFVRLKGDDMALTSEEAEDVKAKIELFGKFNYKELPMQSSALIVLDENGLPIDTIYTDENGNFNYTLLEGDKHFSIVPLNLTDEDLNDLSINIQDKNGKLIQQAKMQGKTFNFEPLKKKKALLASASKKEQHINYQKKEIYNNEIVGSWNGKGEVKATVFFEFAVNEIDEISKEKLAKVLTDLKGEKIILVGHTDNIGSVENNRARGLERANSVKKYLESMGITIKAVELSSKGELDPIAPNKYEKGRAKNRRVEVIMQ